MNKTRKPNQILILAFLLIASISLTCGAMAQDLSPSTKNRLKSSATEMRSKTESIRNNLCESRMDLFKAYQNYNLDDNIVRANINKISSNQLELLNIYLNHQIEIRSILSANEFSRFVSVMHKKSGGTERKQNHHEDAFIDKLPDKQMLDNLNLSNDQMKRLQPYVATEGPRSIAAQKLRNDTRQLIKLYSAYNLDKTAARKLIKSIHENQGKIAEANLKKQKAIRAVLSKDQFKSLIAMISEKLNTKGPEQRKGRFHRN